MVNEVVPKEQMEVFDRPRQMAEPAPEEMMADEPQAAMSDTHVSGGTIISPLPYNSFINASVIRLAEDPEFTKTL